MLTFIHNSSKTQLFLEKIVDCKTRIVKVQELYRTRWVLQVVHDATTVEPPNKGHFGDTASVLISEVVPFSEVFAL